MSTTIESAPNVTFAASDPVGTRKKAEVYVIVTQPSNESSDYTVQADHPGGASAPATRTVTYQGGVIEPTLTVTSTDPRVSITVDPPVRPITSDTSRYLFNVWFEKIS